MHRSLFGLEALLCSSPTMASPVTASARRRPQGQGGLRPSPAASLDRVGRRCRRAGHGKAGAFPHEEVRALGFGRMTDAEHDGGATLAADVWVAGCAGTGPDEAYVMRTRRMGVLLARN